MAEWGPETVKCLTGAERNLLILVFGAVFLETNDAIDSVFKSCLIMSHTFDRRAENN